LRKKDGRKSRKKKRSHDYRHLQIEKVSRKKGLFVEGRGTARGGGGGGGGGEYEWKRVLPCYRQSPRETTGPRVGTGGKEANSLCANKGNVWLGRGKKGRKVSAGSGDTSSRKMHLKSRPVASMCSKQDKNRRGGEKSAKEGTVTSVKGYI